MKGHKQKLFFYIASLEARMEQVKLVWYLIVLIQALLYSIMLIQPYIPKNIKSSVQGALVFYYKANEQMQLKYHTYFFLVSAVVILGLGIGCFVIHIAMTPKHHSLENLSAKLKVCQIITVIVLFLMQIITISGIASAIYSFQNTGKLPAYEIFLQILLFCMITLKVLFNRNQSLMGLMQPLVILLFYITGKQALVLSISIALSSLVRIINQTNKFYVFSAQFQKFLLKFLFCASIWSVIQKYQPSQYNPTVSYILLAVCLVISLLASFIQPIDQFVLHSNRNFENQYLFDFYQKIKKKGMKQISQIQQFKLQKILMKYTQSLKEKIPQSKAVPFSQVYNYQSPIYQWSKQDFMQKLDQKFSSEDITSSQNDLKSIIMGYKVKMIMRKNLLQTLRSLVSSDYMNFPEKRNYYEQYIIYKFSILEIDRYLNDNTSKSNKKQLDTLKLINLESDTKQYYDYVLELINKLQFFWGLLAKDNAHVEDLNEELLNIQKMTQKSFKKLTQLTQKYAARAQKILFAKTMVFVNPQKASFFAKEHLYDEPSIKHNISNKKLDNLAYIKLDSKGIINKISFKIFVQMGYTQDQLFQNHISTIFPPIIDKILFKELQQVHPGNTMSKRIPVLQSSCRQFFTLRRLQLMMYIDFSKGIQYIIHFNQKQRSIPQALIVVDQSTGAILTVSENFISNFNLSLKKVRKSIKESSFFWNEIFPDFKLGSPKAKKIRSTNGLNTKMIVTQISPQTFKSSSVQVNIQVHKQYSLQDKNILLVALGDKHNSKLVQQYKTTSNLNKSINTHQTRRILDGELEKIDIGLESPEKLNAAIYKDQKFFCPIPNPYFLKIKQKRQSMLNQNPGKMGFLMIVKIFFFLLGLIFVGEIVSFYTIQRQKISQFGHYSLNFQRISNQQVLLLNCFSQVFIINYFLKNKDTIVQDLTSLADPNIFKITQVQYKQSIAYHRKKLSQKTRQFQNQFLLTSAIWSSPYVIKTSYTLDFQQYVIHTDTSQANYYDFIQNFQTATLQSTDPGKMKVIQKSFLFLLKNYQSFRSANVTFESTALYVAAIDQPSITIFIVFSVIGLAFLIIVIIMQCLLFKVESVIASIIGICKFVNHEDCQRQIGAIQSLKEKTIQFKYFKNSNNQSRTYNDFNIKSRDNLKQLTESTLNHFIIQDKVQQSLKLQQSQKGQQIQMQSPQDLKASSSKFKNSAFQQWGIKPKKKKTIPVKQTQTKNILGIQYNNSKLILPLLIFLILLFLVAGLLFWQHILYQSSNNEIKKVLKYEQEFLKGRTTTLRHLIDALQTRFVQELYSGKISPFYVPVSYQKTYSAVDYLPKDFDQFFYFYFKNPATKPCQLHYNSLQDPLNKMKTCENIMSGLLDIAYSHALQMYQNIFIKLKSRPLNQYFLSIDGFDDAYPDFLVGLFAKEILQLFIEDGVKKFMMASQNHLKSVQGYITIPLAIWISLGLIYLIAGYIIISMKLQIRTKLGNGYFNILPESIMSKISITTYIRSEKVLEKLDTL